MFLSIATRVIAAFTGSSRQAAAEKTVSIPDLLPTPVDCHSTDIGTSTAPIAKQTRAKRPGFFKRNRKEIQRGLTKEQCIELRAVELSMQQPKKLGRPPLAAKVKPVAAKAPRFRRTTEELRLGLSIEQAAAARGVLLPKPKDIAVVVKPVVSKAVVVKPVLPILPVGQTEVEQLMETLPIKTQVRARAVQRYRLGGGKAVLTKDTLDQIEQFSAAGKVTVRPPFTGSDGFNHMTGQEAK